MAALNDHQSRLLKDMLELFEHFRKGKVTYYNLVGGLEGILDAGEFTDKSFVARWYDLWTPLEIARAQGESNVRAVDVEGYMSDMETYLRSILEAT